MATTKKTETMQHAPAGQTDILDVESGEAGMLSMSQFAELVKQNNHTVEAFVSLREGDGILGTFLGEGPMVAVGEEKVQATTGEVYKDMVPTWRVRIGDKVSGDVVTEPGRIIVTLLGKYGISSFLRICQVGEEVGIVFLKTESRGARRVNKYMTTHRALKERKPAPEPAT